MKRGIHILVTLLAIVMLVRPFDCFAIGAPSQKSADCCLKGKCTPTANSDECCKSVVPDASQLLTPKAADHLSPLVAFTAIHISILISPMIFERLAAPVKHPPPLVGVNADSLPLLI
jgi:hypothetical protein